MKIIALLSLLVLGVAHVQGFDICAAGQIYTAVQSVLEPHCGGCSSYLQCVGNRNAVTRCALISQSDANATATLISTSTGFAQYLSTYLKAAADVTAATNGQQGANCKALYGSSSTCRVRKDPPGPRPVGPNKCALPSTLL